MTVIHTLSSMGRSTGGPAQAVAGLCEALTKCGVPTELVTSSVPAEGPPRTPHPDVKLTAVPGGMLPSLRIGWSREFRAALLQCCAQTKPMLLHGHGIWMTQNHDTAVVARRLKIPLVLSPHGMLTPWSLGFKKLKKKLALLAYQSRDISTARVLHATSEREAAGLAEFGARAPVAVIPLGIDLPPVVARGTRAHSRVRTVLFIGRIHPVKGLANLIQAWARIKPAGWRLLIVGPDEDGHLRELVGLVGEKALERSVEFRSAVDEQQKWEHYRDADLFVLPSFTENFGVVAAEALACKIPVIASRGTPWEGLTRNSCGWWVDNTVEALESALREALEGTDAQRDAMGARGRDWIEREFSWPLIAREMKAVYTWILGGGPPPASIRQP